MRSEFEKLEDVRDILEDHKNIYFDSKLNMYSAKKEETEDSVSYPSWEVTYLNGAWYTFQHQQSKVDELQRRNQMLNDNIKEQGQKLVYQNEVIETQAEKLLGLRDEKAELQKRVDAVQKLIREWKEWVKNNQIHNACVYIEESITELEQALKGDQ